MTVLPNDLVFEILTRLPGKPVARCRCVCKPWRAMIGSRPFRDSYRERQRGLLIWWSTTNRDGGGKLRRHLQFSHCPLRRLKEPVGEFSPLQKLDLGELVLNVSRPVYLTQSVDGLLCVGDVDGRRLTLYNVCTGESMKIPDPLTCDHSSYHLGYDQESGEYKLLRLIYDDVYCESILGAHILTLRPPSSSHLLAWRVLDNVAAGISRLPFADTDCEGLFEASICSRSEDGVLCWYWIYFSVLVCYDFSRERFWFVNLPGVGMRGRFVAVTRCNDSLTIWLELEDEDQLKKLKWCYAVEGDEVKNWSMQSVTVSKHFQEGSWDLVVASGKLPGSSHGDVLVMNPDYAGEDERPSVHYYADKDEDDVFFVGKLPDGFPQLDHRPCYHQWQSFSAVGPEVSCLLESNNMYLSLDHILAPAYATLS